VTALRDAHEKRLAVRYQAQASAAAGIEKHDQIDVAGVIQLRPRRGRRAQSGRYCPRTVEIWRRQPPSRRASCRSTHSAKRRLHWRDARSVSAAVTRITGQTPPNVAQRISRALPISCGGATASHQLRLSSGHVAASGFQSVAQIGATVRIRAAYRRAASARDYDRKVRRGFRNAKRMVLARGNRAMRSPIAAAAPMRDPSAICQSLLAFSGADTCGPSTTRARRCGRVALRDGSCHFCGTSGV